MVVFFCWLELLFVWDRWLLGYLVCCFFCLGRRVSWLVELSVVRGGFVGGDGRFEEGILGILFGFFK